MKHLKEIMLLAGCCLLTSCNNQVENNSVDKWEYKTAYIEMRSLHQGEELGNADLQSRLFLYPNELDDSLATNGKEGWELVDVITEVSTAYPQGFLDTKNCGTTDPSSVKSNVRTS